MKNLLLCFLIFLCACTAAPTTIASPPIFSSPTAYPQKTATTTPVPAGSVQGMLDLPFPRLGMIWPNPYTQPLEKIARYDLVILEDWGKDFIDPIKIINPKISLLNSTNGCELSYRPEDPTFNKYLESIPYQWYLTQVGTTIRTDIDATQTTIPINATVVQAGQTAIDLFIPGDTALIENESVYIEQVDLTNQALIVRRGYVRPASPHKAATRIAAHISFWPNSWVMNLSTLSPGGVFDPNIGSEYWGDYNARVSAQLLSDPRWAGIFVDRSDPNPSWLIGNSTARSIDPEQSNRLPTDYTAFDNAWNMGLQTYLSKLRNAIGAERMIMLNWGINDYATVNGNNFEGIPDDQWAESWHTQIIGPGENGSYFEWARAARQPNITMIETYEDNSRTAPTNTQAYDNPCNAPSFIPSYQKMRFGLASALLNDGYFSYEMNTQGHGALCLLWFDEYDNAAQGRGYLGRPLGDAQNIAKQIIPNMLAANSLETGDTFTTWKTWHDTGYGLSFQADANNPAEGKSAVRIDITDTQGEYWRATFFHGQIQVVKNSEYTLVFYARADKPRTIRAWVQQISDPWNTWLDFGTFEITPDWQKFEITLPSQGDDIEARLLFGVGETTGSVWLDDLQVYRSNLDIWQRIFENGIVIVNATNDTVTIPLETPYKKINGTQDHLINDGSFVTRVSLPPRDGLILLKIK